MKTKLSKKSFHGKVFEIVKKIPRGKTLTYKTVDRKSRKSESLSRGGQYIARQLWSRHTLSSRRALGRKSGRMEPREAKESGIVKKRKTL